MRRKMVLVVIMITMLLTGFLIPGSFCEGEPGDISKLAEQRRFRETEAVCKKRISLDPYDHVAVTQLGNIYWEEKKRRQAIKLFRKAIKLAPDYPAPYFFLGEAYFFERKPEKAIIQFNIFEEKMELLPEMDADTADFYIWALHRICYKYSTQKYYKDAMDACKKIIKLKPDDQRAHYNLAVCYYTYKYSRSRAYSELQKVIEIDPHNRIAEKAKLYIDYMRRNPDSRIIGDFSFLDED